MVCSEIDYLHCILQYIIDSIFCNILFTYYKDSRISPKIRKRFQNTNILLVWSLYYTNQQRNRHQSVGFYKSYKISGIGHCSAPININLLIVC